MALEPLKTPVDASITEADGSDVQAPLVSPPAEPVDPCLPPEGHDIDYRCFAHLRDDPPETGRRPGESREHYKVRKIGESFRNWVRGAVPKIPRI